MKNFSTLQHILPDFFAERQWQQQWQVQRLYTQWLTIIGPEVGKSSLPAAIRNQTLWLYVSHSIWVQEIHYRQGELLGRIKEVMPDQDIRAIRCQVEPSWFAPPAAPAVEPKPAAAAPKADAPHSMGFDAIADPASREALRRLWQVLRSRK